MSTSACRSSTATSADARAPRGAEDDDQQDQGGEADRERHDAAHAAKELEPIKLEVAERWTGSLTESEKRRVLPKPRAIARAR